MADDTIHVLKVDQPIAIPGEAQPTADEATRRLYQAAQPSIVRIEKGSNNEVVGTGFAASRPGLIITDYHCVAGVKELKVRTTSGQLYRARIKDIDDINDLAVLEIEGKTPATLKPLSLGNEATLKPDDKVTALGHPEGLSPVYISPGYYVASSPFRGKMFYGVFGQSAESVETDPRYTPAERLDLKAAADRTLLYSRTHIRHGNSGGPLLDSAGSVVGICDLTGDHEKYSHSFYTPVSDLNKLLNRETPKFRIDYTYSGEDWTNSYKHQLKTNTVLTLAGTGASAGLATYAMTGARQFGRFAPGKLGAGAVGFLGVASIDDDARNLYNATNRLDRLKYGVATLGDGAMISGSAMRLFAKPVVSALPGKVAAEGAAWLGQRGGLLAAEGLAVKTGQNALLKTTLGAKGRIGVGILAVGLAAKLASDFIPNRLIQTDVTRSDGDVRPPLPLYGR